MNLETFLPVFSVAVMALIHGAFLLVALILVKVASSWLIAAAITFGLCVFSIGLTAAGFLLQGLERASSILLPSGEMFAFVFLPTIVSTVIFSVVTIFTTYGLFVAPGAQKHV